MSQSYYLSAVIIALNEECKIKKCLESIRFVDEIVVVDSGSVDRTREIAESYGAMLYERDFDSFSNQKNYAMNQARGEWLLLIDADERVSDELKNEILAFIKSPGEQRAGLFLRKNHMFGGPVSFGANAGDKQLRLIRKGMGFFKGLVHERIECQAQTVLFKGVLIHETYQNNEEYFKKFDRYISLEAKQYVEQKKKWVWIHMIARPWVDFFYFYFLKLGFLDGWRGLKYQLFSSYYTFCKFRKVIKIRKQIQIAQISS